MSSDLRHPIRLSEEYLSDAEFANFILEAQQDPRTDPDVMFAKKLLQEVLDNQMVIAACAGVLSGVMEAFSMMGFKQVSQIKELIEDLNKLRRGSKLKVHQPESRA